MLPISPSVSLNETEILIQSNDYETVAGLITSFSIDAELKAKFNFTLFMALVGILNIGIVSAVKQTSVLNSAFNYGLIAMMCSLPLFGGAAIILAATGTLSLAVLSQMSASPMVVFGAVLMLIGILGESGVAPFFASKAEMFRTAGSPYIVIIHLSSLFIIVRAVEILLLVLW